MSKFNNIINNINNITFMVDFINNVLSLTDTSSVLETLIKKADLQTQKDKDNFLYDLFDYVVRAYKSAPIETFLSYEDSSLIDYFGNMIDNYNLFTNSNYNYLHKNIWHVSLSIVVNDSPIDTVQLLKEIIEDDNFDDCEYRHKTFLLGLQTQMLITSNPIDLEQLNIVSSKLKELNNQK